MAVINAAQPAERELKHTRNLQVNVYKRTDGLWDVEARLTDKKAKDFELVSGTRSKDQPVHDMTVCLTINSNFEVVASIAASHSVPYPGYCDTIGPAYSQLVGLNLLKNFNRDVRAKFGKTSGCTHITELTAVMPTAAVQAFAGESRLSEAANTNAATPPFYIDSCHALDRTGAAVKTYYPQWYRASKPIATS